MATIVISSQTFLLRYSSENWLLYDTCVYKLSFIRKFSETFNIKIVLCQMLLQQFYNTITSNIRNTGYENDLINNHCCATLFAILYSKLAYINRRSNVCLKRRNSCFYK